MPRRPSIPTLLAALTLLTALAAPGVLAQSLAHVEAQSIWSDFWSRVLAGDIDAARRYVHTSRRHLFPFQQTVAELQEVARQMQHCRVQPEPLPTGGEDLLFEVRCEHAGQVAETQVGFRRDLDGVWRLSVL
jgi:hypothetical protein